MAAPPRDRLAPAGAERIGKPTVKIELQQACEFSSVPDLGELQRWIGAAVAKGAAARRLDDRRPCDVVVRIVNQSESRNLNSRYRHKDEPTNVLAFPAGADTVPGLPPARRRWLGDLAICGPLVEQEAQEQGKAPAAHWGHLLVHGALHLLGFDHQTEAEALEMERLETQIMAEQGFADPYA